MKRITKIKYIPEEGKPIVYTVLDYPINFWDVKCYQVAETTDLIPMKSSVAKIEIIEEKDEKDA